MILRDAARGDEPAPQRFDLGEQRTVWLNEVSEILSGLIAWRDDEQRADLDRRVIVADLNGEIIAVAVSSSLQECRSAVVGCDEVVAEKSYAAHNTLMERLRRCCAAFASSGDRAMMVA